MRTLPCLGALLILPDQVRGDGEMLEVLGFQRTGRRQQRICIAPLLSGERVASCLDRSGHASHSRSPTLCAHLATAPSADLGATHGHRPAHMSMAGAQIGAIPGRFRARWRDVRCPPAASLIARIGESVGGALSIAAYAGGEWSPEWPGLRPPAAQPSEASSRLRYRCEEAARSAGSSPGSRGRGRRLRRNRDRNDRRRVLVVVEVGLGCGRADRRGVHDARCHRTADVGTRAVTVMVPTSPTSSTGLVHDDAVVRRGAAEVGGRHRLQHQRCRHRIDDGHVTGSVRPEVRERQCVRTIVPTNGDGVVVDFTIWTSVRTRAGASSQSTLFEGLVPVSASPSMVARGRRNASFAYARRIVDGGDECLVGEGRRCRDVGDHGLQRDDNRFADL